MLLQDVQALVAALEARDWLSAFTLAVKVSNEILADLTKQGVQPHVAKMAYAVASDVGGNAALLRDCCNAGAIDWRQILAVVAAIIQNLLPLIIGGK